MSRLVNMIVMAPRDNVGIALKGISANELAADGGSVEIAASEAIPQGHKIALRPIATGDHIFRMGVPVGLAKQDIRLGSLVHIHNVRSQYLDNDEDHFE